MKIVQIGILVALVVVGGLLFLIWRNQQQPKQSAVLPDAPVTGQSETAPAPGLPAVTSPPGDTSVASKPSPAPTAKRNALPVRAAVQTPPAAGLEPARPVETASSAPVPPAPEPAPAPSSLAEPAPLPAVPAPPRMVTLATGTLLSVRLAETLDSGNLKAGDTFTATLDRPLIAEGLVIAERGARVEGRVLEAEQAGRVKGVSSLAIHLTRLHTSDGQTVQIATDPFRKQGDTSRGEDAKKVGIGAGIGAAIGAIAGGGKGAAIGAGIGGAAGAGTVAATRGKDVVLPVETRLDFRLSSPVTLTEKK